MNTSTKIHIKKSTTNVSRKKRVSKLLIKRKGENKTSRLDKVGGGMEFDVDAVRGQRLCQDKQLEYLVSWKGYERDKDSWIPKLPPFFDRQWKIEQEWSDWCPGMMSTDSTDLHILAEMACLQLLEMS
jgi:hypothetical protein